VAAGPAASPSGGDPANPRPEGRLSCEPRGRRSAPRLFCPRHPV